MVRVTSEARERFMDPATSSQARASQQQRMWRREEYFGDRAEGYGLNALIVHFIKKHKAESDFRFQPIRSPGSCRDSCMRYPYVHK